MAKKGYYTLKRTCIVYYRTEDGVCEPESLKEAKENANELVDCSDLEMDWVDKDWTKVEFEEADE